MLDGLAEYCGAVLSQWKASFTFLPFILDFAMPIIWGGWNPLVERVLPGERRKKFLRYSALFTFVIANYLAFSAENAAKIQAMGDLRQANIRLIKGGQVPATFRIFKDEEKERIKAAFADFSKVGVPVILASHNDDDSMALAHDFKVILAADHVQVMTVPGFLINPNNSGFYVEIRNLNSPSPSSQKFLDAMKATGLQYKLIEFDEANEQIGQDFSLFIGPPPP